MEQLSGYEIAQKRIEDRRNKSNRFKVWIVLLILAVVITLLEGSSIAFCSLPIMLCLVFFLLLDGIEIYVTSTGGELSPELFKQEMGWLFGVDWQNNMNTQEYMLAQDRIQRRRKRRGQFYLHLCGSLIINAAVLYGLYSPPYPRSLDDLKISFIALLLLSFHFYIAFPSRRRLERQEHEFGQAIQAEIAHSIPESAKSKEKPKRDVQYRIGEDGELEEISDYSEDEKPKRTLLD